MVPETNFADEVMEECASFPNGEHDDLADSMTQAILRFRQGGFITTPSDYEDEDLMYSRVEERNITDGLTFVEVKDPKQILMFLAFQRSC